MNGVGPGRTDGNNDGTDRGRSGRRLLAALDAEISLPSLMRLFPLAFLLHDLEEVLTVEAFWQRHRDRLPLPAALRRGRVTTRQFAVAVAGLFGVVLLISERAARAPGDPSRLAWFRVGLAIMLANVFTHLGQSLLLRADTPGVATALAISLPYSAYAFRRLARAGLSDRSAALTASRHGLLRLLPAVGAALGLGWLVDRLLRGRGTPAPAAPLNRKVK
jgi:hypothetical protein